MNIKREYKRIGFNYRQILRWKNTAIYSQIKDVAIIAYEIQQEAESFLKK